VTRASVETPSCIFCAALNGQDDDPLVVHRGPRAFVILNKFPYNNGHVMVVPNRHAARLTDLSADELSDVIRLAQTMERALTAAYRPHGFNMGINVGQPAGAGILDHLHLHVVPRWNGDTSYMTVFGETRVLPEELGVTADRIRASLRELAAGQP
jgi:ATP adenylyltransferase